MYHVLCYITLNCPVRAYLVSLKDQAINTILTSELFFPQEAAAEDDYLDEEEKEHEPEPERSSSESEKEAD